MPPVPQPPSPPDLPYVADKIYNIPLLKIRVAPQVRSHVTTTEAPFLALKESIREHGVLQPIMVRPHGDRYQIVAGERRFRAAQGVGLAELPAVIREVPDDRMLEMALIENLQRQDLDAIEKCRGRFSCPDFHKFFSHHFHRLLHPVFCILQDILYHRELASRL